MPDQFTVAKLNDEIEQEWDKFIHLVQEFPEDRYEVLLVGQSTFKDVLAHIYEWEKFLLDNLPAVQSKTVIPHKLNIKKMNTEFLERNKNRSRETILNDLVETHKEVAAMVSRFDEELLGEPDPFYPKKYNIYNLIQHATSLHYSWAVKYLRRK